MPVKRIIMNANEPKIAILVDGDNAQPKMLKLILEEVSAKYGKATIRRIYGDWTDSKMKGWKNAVNELSFDPRQKFTYTSGKNSTDGALIIDAMDILHSKLVDGFCIVSSDSDFTGLAKRIREEGIQVIGMGKKTTPKAFIQSCEVFTFVENLSAEPASPTEETEAATTVKNEEKITKTPQTTAKTSRKNNTKPAGKTKQTTVPQDITELLNKAFYSIVNENDEANLAELGSALKRLDPSFDVRTYGVNSFLKFLRLMDIFDIRDNTIGKHNHPIVKMK